MNRAIHFISGLPRSGSTLLAALLRQNPGIHAGMSSALGGLFQRLLTGLGPQNEMALSLTDAQRRSVLRGLFDNYYYDIAPEQLVVDTNRLWCSKMAALMHLFPKARVIVCVRELLWVMDSFERILQKNPLLVSKMLKPQDNMTVHSRVTALGSGTGTVGFPWNAVQEAFYGEHAGRLVVIDYEALAREPERTMEFLYKTLDLPVFAHDFDNVAYDEGSEFDAQIGVPGLHAVAGKVAFRERATLLPPDLVQRFSGRNFWRRPGGNPRNAPVILPSGLGSRKMPQPAARMPLQPTQQRPTGV